MAYSDVILGTTGLVSYWRLDETSGTPVTDSKGANTGTYVNTPTLGVSGRVPDFGTCVTFDDVQSECITVPDHNSLDFGDTFTYEAWMKRTGTSTTHGGVIFDKGALGPLFKLNGVNGALLLRRNSVADVCTSTTTILDNTQWHHVVATKSGATSKIYLDGVDRTGTVTDSTMISTTTPLTIAAADAGANSHLGATLDEVAVYNVALSAGTVLAHFEAGQLPPVVKWTSAEMRVT